MSMRVTQSAVQSGVQRNLQTSMSKLMRLQEQLSSGKALSKPSDSPSGTVSALRYRAEIQRGGQLQRNADDALGWLATSDRSLQAVNGVLGRARELVLTGLNATSGTAEREALAVEIDRLRESALAAANTTYLGRPVFGGTAAGGAAYDSTTGAWLGDSGSVERSVAPGVSVRVDVSGESAFGSVAGGSDVFSLLARISSDLRTNPGALSADLTALDTGRDRVMSALSSVGAKVNQVEAMRDRVSGAVLDATTGLGEVESIDLPATIMQLQLQEVAYQAALSATSRVIQPSLVDFLR